MHRDTFFFYHRLNVQSTFTHLLKKKSETNEYELFEVIHFFTIEIFSSFYNFFNDKTLKSTLSIIRPPISFS